MFSNQSGILEIVDIASFLAVKHQTTLGPNHEPKFYKVPAYIQILGWVLAPAGLGAGERRYG